MSSCKSIASFALLLACLLGSTAGLRAQVDPSLYVNPTDVPVRALDVRAAFEGLSPEEKLYAHWMSMAAWCGNLITFEQLSPESPLLLELFQGIYSCHPVALRKTANRLGVTDQELEWLEQYAARVYSNCGNYLSFGDTRFVPRLAADKFALVCQAADELIDTQALDGSNLGEMQHIFSEIENAVYSLDPKVLSLGLEDTGVSAYYGEDVTRAEIDLVGDYMRTRGMEAWNTRISKEADGTLVLRVASALEQPETRVEHKGRNIVIRYGDFANHLRRVVMCLENALRYAANDNQRRMILAYITHMNGGDIEDHKKSQEFWVKDKGPVVETNLGFIETYRDPVGVRAEWEGLVAVVNKEQTRKFGVLVDNAPSLIPLLPWGKDFEKPEFQKPDFTSLEVLCFASSGIPAGINIPNYDDIRQGLGFKNVSLGNVLRAGGLGDERIQFLRDEDQDIFRKWIGPSFEVQVGLHELLGHGSGKLLEEKADGSRNFDGALVDPTTDKPVATWYHPGETWGSKFTTISSSYEECRAESVGMHLCTLPKVLEIFGHPGEEGQDVAYVNWLSMARAGLSALSFYDPANERWGQAHMQARFAILQVMLSAGEDFLKIEKNAQGDWIIHLNRSLMAQKGAPAIADFLKRLNVYKATANDVAARNLYKSLTTVDSRFMEIRDYVMQKRKPRHIWVQAVTDIDLAGQVVLREYPATNRGVIESFVDRYAFMRE